MYFFNFDIKKALLVMTLVIIPVFLVTLDREQVENNRIFRALFFIAGKIQTSYQSCSAAIYNTADTYLNLIHTKQQNRDLQQANTRLKAQLSLLKEVEQENKRLKELLQFSHTTPFQVLFAQVSGRDPLSQYQLITINRGAQHGVKKNMLAINKNGVIGYVFRVHKAFSQIILLTDSHSATSVVIQRSRVHGVLEGTGKNTAQFKYLKKRDDVQIGDVVVTARGHPVLAGGFPVGTVSEVTKKPYGLTQEVTVIPFINTSQIEEVLLVSSAGSP